mmetsp:Transcript_86055/g.196284  ORF Transcript_86055/g.196284 Transcript_86055/m.196284 type:complete len:419 (+) Transcript_86055:78-1334(+)
MVFPYDPNENMFLAGFTYTHTVVELCFQKLEFWMLLTVHLFAAILFKTGHLDAEAHKHSILYLPWSLLGILVALTSFFIVFYTNYCFSRYMELYGYTRDMLASLMEATQELRFRMPIPFPEDDDKALPEHESKVRGARRAILRYLVASMYLFFFYMSGNDISENEYQQLINQGLLYVEEKAWLENFPGHPHSVVLDFALQVASEALGPNRNRHIRAFSRIANFIRRSQVQIDDQIKMPMPFQIFHICSLMLTINFTLWAYGMGMYQTSIATIIFFFTLLIFLGMKELSAALADPFGDDVVDFPLNAWLLVYWKDCHYFLEADAISLIERPENFEGAEPLWVPLPGEEEVFDTNSELIPILGGTFYDPSRALTPAQGRIDTGVDLEAKERMYARRRGAGAGPGGPEGAQAEQASSDSDD